MITTMTPVVLLISLIILLLVMMMSSSRNTAVAVSVSQELTPAVGFSGTAENCTMRYIL
jgi:hypothetical protein